MKKNLTVVLAGALLFLVPILGYSGGSQDASGQAKKPAYELRFGHTLTEADLFHKGYLEWAQKVLEATGGDLQIEVYANSQLGVEEDVLEQIRQGTNIGWQTDFARAGSYIREMGVLNCPYFLENTEDVKKCLTSPTINGWCERLASEFGLRPLSFTFIQGYRSVFSNKEARNPTEMKSMSIRTANAASWVESVRSLGCTPVALNYGDMYTGIQTKVVDGCELPYNAALNLKIQEVAKNIIETKHIFQLQLAVLSEIWYKKLPANYQKILVDEMVKEGFKVSEELDAAHEVSKQTMIKAGMKLIPYSELDIAAFKKNSQSAYDALNLDAARRAVYADIGKQVF
jgi:TRAP-type C4-dicarboxylate transport system substrate-binding protein